MELAGFLLLLVLTGREASASQELDSNGTTFNQSVEETPGGNDFISNLTDYFDPSLFNMSMGLSELEMYMHPVTLRDQFLSFEELEERDDFPPDSEMVRYDNCRYQDVLNHFKVTKSNDLFTMSRPVQNHTTVTKVKIAMAISAILDLRETDQTFISYIWILMIWKNEFIRWNPDNFCQIRHVLVPTDVLWKPDIVIEEMIEKDKSPPSDFLRITSNGEVEYRNDQVVISSCKMRVHKFPFDIQMCNITFKSFMHSDDEMNFIYHNDTARVTELSRTVMQTQFEWLFIKMTVNPRVLDIGNSSSTQTSIVYTIYMKRRSILYIANFLMPILFFLCLDLSSFLIADGSGEKLGFKVTVLLAVTVMQLILNEILPCSSDRIPLIAVFCIGIFSLMMLSLLETMFVMYLIGKDSETPDGDSISYENDKGSSSCFKDICSKCVSCHGVSALQTPLETKEGSSSQLTEVSLALGRVSDELGQIERIMTSPGAKPGYWSAVTKTINKTFFILYLTSVTLFLAVVFTMWRMSEEEQ